MGAGEGDVSDVEEEESGLGGMGLDGFGGELRGFDFVALFLVDGAFHFLLRDGKRDLVGVGAGIGEAAVDIVRGSGGEFGVVGGDEFDVDVGDGDWLGAVVGDDEEDGKESVLAEVDGEYFGFVGSVVGVGGDGDLFVGMVVVRGIGFGGAGGWLDEVFGSEGRGQGCEGVEGEKSAAAA